MTCDLLIKNGLLIDGTGAPARHADQELESRVYDISTRIADTLQMSLEQLFSQPQQDSAADSSATRGNAVE